MKKAAKGATLKWMHEKQKGGKPWSDTRPRRIVVGREGRLDASARVCSAGRRHRGFVGPCVPASQGRRPEQRSVLVQPGWQTCVPGTAGRGMGKHREGFARIDRPLAFCGCQSNQTGVSEEPVSALEMYPCVLCKLRLEDCHGNIAHRAEARSDKALLQGL